MFCIWWIGGEVAPELGREAQGIQWISLQQNLGGLGKRTYIIFVTLQWACSWRIVVCEGLSRRTAGVGVGAAGAEVARGAVAAAATAGGAIRTRVQGTT